MPSQFFKNFPYITYTLNPNSRPGDYSVVTDIFKRIRIYSSVLNDARVYYPYQIKDGDTPENISHRYYGSVDYYWVILLINQIVDPLREWPKSYTSFLNYIIDKYGSTQTAMNTIHHYNLTITKTNSLGESSETTYEVDQTAYDAASSVVPEVYTFSDGTTVTKTITRSSVDSYSWEESENENKRNIVLLKEEYIPQIKNEIEALLGV